MKRIFDPYHAFASRTGITRTVLLTAALALCCAYVAYRAPAYCLAGWGLLTFLARVFLLFASAGSKGAQGLRDWNDRLGRSLAFAFLAPAVALLVIGMIRAFLESGSLTTGTHGDRWELAASVIFLWLGLAVYVLRTISAIYANRPTGGTGR